MTTLVMAGSLVQVPSVVASSGSASASPSAQGGQGNIGLLQGSRRFRFAAGILHVVCRLIVVSKCQFLCANPAQRGVLREVCATGVAHGSLVGVSLKIYRSQRKARNDMPVFS